MHNIYHSTVYRHSMILSVSSHQPNGVAYLLNICFRQKAVRLQRSPSSFMGVHAGFSVKMAMALFLLCVSCSLKGEILCVSVMCIKRHFTCTSFTHLCRNAVVFLNTSLCVRVCVHACSSFGTHCQI